MSHGAGADGRSGGILHGSRELEEARVVSSKPTSRRISCDEPRDSLPTDLVESTSTNGQYVEGHFGPTTNSMQNEGFPPNMCYGVSTNTAHDLSVDKPLRSNVVYLIDDEYAEENGLEKGNDV